MRNITLLLITFISSVSFAGSGIDLGGSTTLYGTLNPSVTATDASPGWIYQSTNGNAYVKQDNGASTNWSSLALSAATFSSIGPFDSNAPGANGLTATGSNIYAQSASATVPGMVNQASQVLGAGTKTIANIIDSGLTANTAIYADASKQLTSSAVTPTELGYLSGATSALQTQMNARLQLAGGTMTGQLFGKNSGGTISAPQFGFTTAGGFGGMYYDGSVVGLTFNSNFFLTGNATGVVMPGVVSVGAGSAGGPGLNINGEPSTGFYYISAGKLGYSGQGALKASFSNAGVESVTGNIIVSAAGKGLTVKTGSNAKSGHATCSAGSVSVSNTSVTANSHVHVSIMSPGGVVTGAPWISSFTAASGFTISCSSASDTSVVGYDIIEEIP